MRTTYITWTPRNTLEMSSLSGRTIRTVKEMALALLLNSSLPLVFWYEAVTRAVHSMNMLPTKTSMGYMSPAEFLTGDASNDSELKIWGCKAWAIVSKEHRRKEWKDKGKPGYYMGVGKIRYIYLIRRADARALPGLPRKLDNQQLFIMYTWKKTSICLLLQALILSSL